MVSSINLWVVFALLLVYSLAVVALLLKKVTHCKNVIDLNLVPGCKCFSLFAVQLQKGSPNR